MRYLTVEEVQVLHSRTELIVAAIIVAACLSVLLVKRPVSLFVVVPVSVALAATVKK